MALLEAVVGLAANVAGLVADSLTVGDRYGIRGAITSPPANSETQGRYLTITGECRGWFRSAECWVAIQPSDCRGPNWWWVQAPALNVSADGTWIVPNARLGREGPEAELDIGATFTIGLFAVKRSAREPFLRSLNDGERMTPPPGSRVLASLEVRRVRH
jgi:hypothetical protein